MKPLPVFVPSRPAPIKRSPGFAKKRLSDWHLELVAFCGFGCRYCFVDHLPVTEQAADSWAETALREHGRELRPGRDPELFVGFTDLEDLLRAQLDSRARISRVKDGEVLILSMLTDPGSPWAVKTGLTRRVLETLFERTSFRVRILSKSAVFGHRDWIEFLARHADRVVVGFSIGSLDREWTRRVELGCSTPAARVRATRALQDAGVPTFGMLCPVLPSEVPRFADLVSAIRPDRCETVWVEPYNDRQNWRHVAAGFDAGSTERAWFEEVYGSGFARERWSRYALALWNRSRRLIPEDKFLYLLYERELSREVSRAFLDGGRVPAPLLLQSLDRKTGASRNPVFRSAQER